MVEFEHCIVACGSSPVRIPGLPYDDRGSSTPRRARAAGHPAAPAGDRAASSAWRWRRCTRVGQPGGRRGAAGRIDPRLRSRSGQAAAEAHGEAPGRILLGTRVKEIKPARTGSRPTSRGRRAGRRAIRQGAGGGGPHPNGNRINAAARASPPTSAASYRSTSTCAPTCRTSLRSATWWGTRCSPTGDARGQGRGRGDRGLPALFDPLAIPSWPIRTRGRLDGLTETDAKAKGLTTRRQRSPGRRADGRRASAATRGSPSSCSTPKPSGCWVRASSARMRGADRRRRARAGDGGGRRGHCLTIHPTRR